MMYGDGWGAGWGVLMGIIMIVVIALVALGIVLLVRALSGPPRSGGGSSEAHPSYGAPPEARRSRALEVLEERYARGEIEREEFLQRRQDLLTADRP